MRQLIDSRQPIPVRRRIASVDADPEQCESLIREAEAHFGSVDILINNAGIQHVAPTESYPVDQWNDVLAINLSAAFHTIRAVLPGMQRRNQGRIIRIASVHGMVASINKAAYVAAKHGLIGFTKVVALENAANKLNDADRFALIMSQVAGKRLTYAKLTGKGTDSVCHVSAGTGQEEPF